MRSDDFFHTWQHKLLSDFASPSGQPATWASPTAAPFQHGSEQHTLDTGAKVHAVAHSPDGALLAVGAGETVVVYATASWKRVRTLGRRMGKGQTVVFSPDGKHLVCSSQWREDRASRHILRAWSVDDSIVQGADEVEVDLEGVAEAATAVALEEIVKQGAWSVEEITEHRDALQADLLKVLRSTSISVSLERKAAFPGSLGSFGSTSFLPATSTLLYLPTRVDGDAHTVEAVSLPSRATLFHLVGHTDKIMSIEPSPSNPLICTASWDGTVRLWSSPDGTPSHVLRGPGRQCQMWVAKFSPDGTLVAAGSGSSEVWIWSADSGDFIQKLEGFPGWVRSLAWAGGMLATGSSGGVVRVFETKEWEIIQRWEIDEQGSEFARGFISMDGLRWSGDGTRLLFRGSDARVTVQDVARNIKWEFEAPPGARQGVAAVMSENGKTVVCGGDGFARVWDI